MNHLIIQRSGLSAMLTFLFFQAIGQSDKEAINEINDHRKKQQQEMRDPEKSPLVKKERKHFKGLEYYPIELGYRVKARFVKTENPVLFKMKTTTTRLPEYSKYGEVYFTLAGVDYKLEVYQSPDIMKQAGYEDYLFIPFTDETNGKETYEVGRYVDFRIPTSEYVTVDFNQCYNPYCSYGGGYSCPVPPEVNNLPIEVKAGEKKFKAQVH